MTARVSNQEVGGLLFNGEFDSGNISRVEHRGESSFAVWTRSDCEGTAFQTSFRTWFSFSVQKVLRGQMLHFEVNNMNPQVSLSPTDRALYPAPPGTPLHCPYHPGRASYSSTTCDLSGVPFPRSPNGPGSH